MGTEANLDRGGAAGGEDSGGKAGIKSEGSGDTGSP